MHLMSIYIARVYLMNIWTKGTNLGIQYQE